MATVAAAVADGPSMKLQIVVDKNKNRVIFAEANKEFVDFIFNILSLPLGSVQRILTKTSSTFGSIGTLYDALKNLDTKYTEVAAKDYLLHAKAPYSGENSTLLLPEASFSKPRQFFLCSHDQTVCVGVYACRQRYSGCPKEIIIGGPVVDKIVVQGVEKGYVKEAAIFMVMDDLAVRPAEPASVISLMNQQSINDVRDVEKREVTFATAEAVKLLKASVSSKTVLTDVFLRSAIEAEK